MLSLREHFSDSLGKQVVELISKTKNTSIWMNSKLKLFFPFSVGILKENGCEGMITENIFDKKTWNQMKSNFTFQEVWLKNYWKQLVSEHIFFSFYDHKFLN